MALLGMGDVHYNVCSSCGVLEVPWIHSGTLLRTILDYVGYIITGLHRLLCDDGFRAIGENTAELKASFIYYTSQHVHVFDVLCG